MLSMEYIEHVSISLLQALPAKKGNAKRRKILLHVLRKFPGEVGSSIKALYLSLYASFVRRCKRSIKANVKVSGRINVWHVSKSSKGWLHHRHLQRKLNQGNRKIKKRHFYKDLVERTWNYNSIQLASVPFKWWKQDSTDSIYITRVEFQQIPQ